MVTITEPMVTREMTIENTWIDWLGGDCRKGPIRQHEPTLQGI